MRWQGPLLSVADTYHTDDTFQLRADDTALRSTLLVSAFGPSCWSPDTHHTDDTFPVRADDTALRSTLLVSAFGRISSPPAGHRPLRSGTAQAPPIRLVCSALCQHIAQRISANCQHKPQKRPSTSTFFLRFGALRYARRATDKHIGIDPSNDHRRGLRLLREPIDQHIPLLSEPDRPSRDPLGLRAPFSRSSCRGSFLVVLPGKEQAVLVECLGFFVGEVFQYTRYRMNFSTYVDPSWRRKKCCPLSAENSTATSLTQLGPLSDLS